MIPRRLHERIADALPIARNIQQGDQRRRAQLYRELGLVPDFTLGEAAEGESEG